MRRAAWRHCAASAPIRHVHVSPHCGDVFGGGTRSAARFTAVCSSPEPCGSLPGSRRHRSAVRDAPIHGMADLAGTAMTARVKSGHSGQHQQLQRSAPGVHAPDRRPTRAAAAVTDDAGRRTRWSSHGARTARTEGYCAAQPAFALNHAITGSGAAAPPKPPAPNFRPATNSWKRNDPAVNGKNATPPDVGVQGKEPTDKQHE